MSNLRPLEEIQDDSFLKTIKLPQFQDLSDEYLIQLVENKLKMFEETEEYFTPEQCRMALNYLPYCERADLFAFIANTSGFLVESIRN